MIILPPANAAASTRCAGFASATISTNPRRKRRRWPMSSLTRPGSVTRPAPPDQPQRERALDARRSILVQAPAGSGKTDLLTRRFLRLLTEVDDPGRIVAITFTKAAAAEMRNRILAELEKAGERGGQAPPDDEFSMEALANRALLHSNK